MRRLGVGVSVWFGVLVNQMKRSYLLNLSLGSLKAEYYGACVQFCDQVLDEDPFHLKALYRKAQVSLARTCTPG